MDGWMDGWMDDDGCLVRRNPKSFLVVIGRQAGLFVRTMTDEDDFIQISTLCCSLFVFVVTFLEPAGNDLEIQKHAM
jgi:hypothetical protein